jgi:hypothetical protein
LFGELTTVPLLCCQVLQKGGEEHPVLACCGMKRTGGLPASRSLCRGLDTVVARTRTFVSGYQ